MKRLREFAVAFVTLLPPSAFASEFVEDAGWQSADAVAYRGYESIYSNPVATFQNPTAIYGTPSDPDSLRIEEVKTDVRDGVIFARADKSSRLSSGRFGKDITQSLQAISTFYGSSGSDGDVDMKFEFTGINYYDGQDFMLSKDTGATVCIQTGTTTELSLADFFAENGIFYEPVPIETNAEAQPLYLEGACVVYSMDASSLAVTRTAFENPGDHVVLPDIISKESLGPLVRHGDHEWGEIVCWTLDALITAEELGVTSENLEVESGNSEVNRMLGHEGNLSTMIGFNAEWPKRAISEDGNYGEVFASNIGSETPIGLVRDLNAQWKGEGLLYSPPFR